MLLLFQPAEEGLAGGKLVVESGALEGVAAIHGLHVWPTLNSGMFTSKVHHKQATLVSESESILALALSCHQQEAIPERGRDSISTLYLQCLAQAGTIMAGSTSFEFTLEGRGGHAAMPHLSVDPVVAAAAIVQALQPLVSRETDPVDGAVISVTRVNTGQLLPVLRDMECDYDSTPACPHIQCLQCFRLPILYHVFTIRLCLQLMQVLPLMRLFTRSAKP